ncbi:MAG TPA: hypothetical protein VII63_10285 [Caulobacteraceae bacterium]
MKPLRRPGRVWISLWVALPALVLASAVQANGADDGEAGLTALKAGSYDQAVMLFTRALNSGSLAGDDREFALASRGRAYLLKGEMTLAIADLQVAQRMKPDDSDAEGDLVNALSSRGRAYLKTSDTSLAIVDLDMARRLSPDDADAQNDLVAALTARLPVSQIPGAAKLEAGSIWGDLGRALLAGALQGIQEGLSDDTSNGQTPN